MKMITILRPASNGRTEDGPKWRYKYAHEEYAALRKLQPNSFFRWGRYAPAF